MSAKQFKFAKKHTVIYPGSSKSVGINQLGVNIEAIDDSILKGFPNNVEDKILVPVVRPSDNNNLVGQNATEKLENYFRLDWVESHHKQSRIKGQSTTSLTKYNSEVSIKKISSSTARQSNLVIKPNHIYSKDMQANQANTGSGRNLIDQESITLDMRDDEINQQYPATSDDYTDDPSLAGQLTDGTPEIKQRLSDDYNQLDEPIMVTLMRDLSSIYDKMKIIALPLSSYDIYKVVLRGWDLWGPLLLCTFLAFNLHHSENKDNHAGPHFADIFVLIWFGSCVVSLNYRLLSISGANNQVQQMSKPSFQSQKSPSIYDNPKNIAQTTASEANIATVDNQQQYEAHFQTLLSPPSIFQLMCVFGYCLVAPCFGLVLLKMFSLTRLFFERIIIGLLFGFAWPTFCSVRILVRYQHPEKRALAIYPIGLFYFVLSCMIILNH